MGLADGVSGPGQRRHTPQEAPVGLVRVRHRAETLPAVAAQLVQAAVITGAGIGVGRDGLVIRQRLLGESRPGHRRRRMRGGDDARVLVGEQFRFNIAVGGKQDRIRSQKITHRCHDDIVPGLG